MPELITIYWRDIPAQVMAKKGRQRIRHKLSDRFAQAIDRAAMRAKKTDADAYLDDWRRVSQRSDGEMESLVEARATALEAEYDDARLDAIIRNKGMAPDQTG